jgi:hypothetical protein
VIDLQDLLERRARMIDPSLDALARVMGTVRRRHRRRKAMAWASAMCVLAAGLTATVVARHPPVQKPRVVLAAQQLFGTRQALALRSELGIEGRTKGAPQSVVVTERTRTGRVEVSLVHLRTGKSTQVQLDGSDTKDAQVSVSPKDDVVAAVGHKGVVVASPNHPTRAAVIPETEGAEGEVSWDGTGSVLFARVKDQWVRVSNATEGSGLLARHVVHQVTVPDIPGGPILLSVSPGGGVAALFGITYPEGQAPVPHLFVGRFDGAAVMDPREIEIPAGALAGPMGWVGDNAFLLAPGPERALVVRTDGSRIEVTPEGIENPCSAVPSPEQCASVGARLLGTNADGSLLFWKVSAEPSTGGSAPAILVLYYKTWLDGSHGVRLGGLVGRLGPPVAPR